MDHELVRVIDLFSGIGGMSLGVGACLKGHEIAVACDVDPGSRLIMSTHFQIEHWYDDIRSIDAPPLVDLVYGGFPCQDISHAGRKAGLIDGTRSSLFFEMLRIANASGAAYLLIENVAALIGRGFEEVTRALTADGWSWRATRITANRCGAKHLRERVFILARRRSCPRLVFPTKGAEVGPWREETMAPRVISAKRKEVDNALRMLGNSCVPVQCHGALLALLGVPPELAADVPWDMLWDAQPHNCLLATQDTENCVRHFLSVPPPVGCLTMLANDGNGGSMSHKQQDGTYGSISICRWVKKVPKRGHWGQPATVAEETKRSVGLVMNPRWGCWFMGFPDSWLDCLL